MERFKRLFLIKKRSHYTHPSISFKISKLEVAIDGCHHSEFMHRTPFSYANALKIDGDVRIHMVEFKGMAPYNPGLPSVPPVPSFPVFPSVPTVPSFPGHTGMPHTRLDVHSPVTQTSSNDLKWIK